MTSEQDSELRYNLSAIGTRLEKPIVLVELSNAHAAGPSIIFPMIVDSGADLTCLPRDVAEQVGHDFEAGTEINLRGVSGNAKARRHTMNLRLIGPGVSISSVDDSDIIPGSWKISTTVCEPLREVGLLGCHDFLIHWDYRINMSKKVFCLIPTDSKLRRSIKLWKQKHQPR